MRRIVTREEATRNFGAVLDTLKETAETRIIDDSGELIAIVTAPTPKPSADRARYWAAVAGVDELSDEEIAERERAWNRFWATVDRIQERNADKDPDEVYRDVTAIVEEVRQERYERERAAAQGRG